MGKSTLVKDKATRDALLDIEKRLDRIENIPQIPSTASIGSVIDILNKIIGKVKR